MKLSAAHLASSLLHCVMPNLARRLTCAGHQESPGGNGQGLLHPAGVHPQHGPKPLLRFNMTLFSVAILSHGQARLLKLCRFQQIQAEARWCVSGTPIVNSATDAYSLFNFIRYRQDFTIHIDVTCCTRPDSVCLVYTTHRKFAEKSDMGHCA
jgi:SNF2-related domain